MRADTLERMEDCGVGILVTSAVQMLRSALARANTFSTDEERRTLNHPTATTGLPLTVAGNLVGIVLPNVLAAMRDHPDVFVIGDGRVELHDRLQTPHDRTEAVEGVLVSWRDQKKFPSLKGWRSERYSVWGNGSSAAGGSRTQVVMEVERAAAGLFGMRGYGCHVNGYVTDSGTGQLRMWIAKRSLTKQTYPGMLDNLVGGGLAHGYDPRSNIVKECFEEAGITDVSKLKAVSVINFFGYSTDRGLLPDTEYLYDIELPEGWEPVCQDGEVAGFSLLTIEEVKQHLAAGEFMPESGLCVVDFLLRHGFVDASSEPDYVDISVGLRRPLPFPGPTYGV